MSSPGVFQPQAPAGSPPWATPLIRGVIDWVEAKLRGPFPLTRIATAVLPTTIGRGAIAYDDTVSAPTSFDGTSWSTVQLSGGPASFSTLSITQGGIISGTYLPTLTSVANLDASTAYNCQYMRVGNVVEVSGKVDVDPTALLSTKLGISLPIASTFSAAEKCAGTAVANSIASEVAAIEADTVNNRAQMEWITVSLANHSMYFSFTYLIT